MAVAASRLFAFNRWALRWAREGCSGMLCSCRVTEGSVQGCFPTGPHAWDPPGAGAGALPPAGSRAPALCAPC